MPRPRWSRLALGTAWVALCACGPGHDQAPTQRPVSGASVSPTRAISLPDGQSVSVPLRARAIVPAAAGAVDIVCALVSPERVAALPRQALKYSGLRNADSPYLKRTRFEVYTAEPILAAGPDLVLAHSWQRGDTTARLTEAGVPVVILPDPRSWDEVVSQVRLVGRLVGAEAAAEELLASYQPRVDVLERSRPDVMLTALCYSNGGAGGWVAGASTTNDEILRLAGLRNLAAEAGRVGHDTITVEELLVLDPDVFVVGGAADAQQPGGTLRMLQEDPSLEQLRAVRGGRVLVLDSWLYTTVSQHMVDAAERLAELARPLAQARARADGGPR